MVKHNIKVEEPLSLTTKLTSFQTLATTLLAHTTLLSLFTINTLPYTNSVLGLEALFLFWNPEDGTDKLSRNVGTKLPLLAA